MRYIQIAIQNDNFTDIWADLNSSTEHWTFSVLQQRTQISAISILQVALLKSASMVVKYTIGLLHSLHAYRHPRGLHRLHLGCAKPPFILYAFSNESTIFFLYLLCYLNPCEKVATVLVTVDHEYPLWHVNVENCLHTSLKNQEDWA